MILIFFAISVLNLYIKFALNPVMLLNKTVSHQFSCKTEKPRSPAKAGPGMRLLLQFRK